MSAPRCGWFAGCGRPATATTPHPILGEVPTCDRCHTFATGEHRTGGLTTDGEGGRLSTDREDKDNPGSPP